MLENCIPKWLLVNNASFFIFFRPALFCWTFFIFFICWWMSMQHGHMKNGTCATTINCLAVHPAEGSIGVDNASFFHIFFRPHYFFLFHFLINNASFFPVRSYKKWNTEMRDAEMKKKMEACFYSLSVLFNRKCNVKFPIEKKNQLRSPMKGIGLYVAWGLRLALKRELRKCELGG